MDGLTFDKVVRSGDIALSVQNVTKAYGGKTLFRNLSFVVRRGDRVVIRGANGSGKTTLLNLILGRDQPDSGTIEFGAKVRMASVDQVPQDSNMDRTPLDICGTGTRTRTYTDSPCVSETSAGSPQPSFI